MTRPPAAPPLSRQERLVFRRMRAELRARCLWRIDLIRRTELVAMFLLATLKIFRDLERMGPQAERETAEITRDGHRACRCMLADLGLIERSRVWPPPAPGGDDADLLAFVEAPQ